MQSLHGNGHVDPKYFTVGISLASIPPIVHVHYHVREGRRPRNNAMDNLSCTMACTW